jgi:phospholipid-binding lipoprotein MlaA
MQKIEYMKKKLRFMSLILMAVTALSVSGCSTTGNHAYGVNGEIHDPLEKVNRATFAFNDTLDQVILEPVTRGYKAVTPDFVREGLHNFLINLKSPITFANQLLQGDLEGAGNVLLRTTVNTFTGFGGLMDVAANEGIEYEPEDFGQTLAVWGVGHGPYLVLPIMGPSSFRDATGIVVDTIADPLRLYLFNTNQEDWYYARVVAASLDKRESLLDALDDLRKNSLDYYASIRSAYYQKRQTMINDESPDAMNGPDIPDYDEEDE